MRSVDELVLLCLHDIFLTFVIQVHPLNCLGMRCCPSISCLVLRRTLVRWWYPRTESNFLDMANSSILDFVISLDTCTIYWDFLNWPVLVGRGTVSSLRMALIE